VTRVVSAAVQVAAAVVESAAVGAGQLCNDRGVQQL
jgi:hypothetical protein